MTEKQWLGQYAAWRRRCNEESRDLLGFDCLDEENSYDLDDAAMFDWRDTEPEMFVRGHFCEDLARMEGEDQLAAEAEGGAA